jgi:nucleotide-binding universal stress UspA family protein
MVFRAMNHIFSYLQDRSQEFDRHYNIACMLEGRVDAATVDGDIEIEVRHINTIKSGLLVHLYNIVEAVSTRTLKEVGRVVSTERPGLWTEVVLKEWVRSEFWATEERLGETALKHLSRVSGKLVSGNNTEAFQIKGESGSWDDDSIKKVAERLGCDLIVPMDIKRKAREKIYRNEKSAFQYLALRRNDLAHGNSTFEESASDLTLNDIQDLAERILPYLKEVTSSYEMFLSNKCFLKSEIEAA